MMDMNDSPPDRLCISAHSPYYNEALLQRGIGVRFKGQERKDVEEYSVSEQWIRVALPRKTDRHGRPLTMKLTGEIEVWFENPAAIEETHTPESGENA
jgi:Protein of unknown function (DUF3297)